MKKMTFAIFLLVVTMSCKQTNTSVMQDISYSFSGVEFSKSVNEAEKHCISEAGKLMINGTSKTNYFNAPDGSRKDSTAPILLTEIDNSKPFTFSVKLQSSIKHTYDAGAVYIYLDNNHWLKFAFELDELKRRRVVTVKTNDFSDDNNHDIVEQDFVYYKISSNLKQIGFYYSLDNQKWNLARLFKNEYPAKLWIGLSSQSPGGKGNICAFENISLKEESIKNFRLGE